LDGALLTFPDRHVLLTVPCRRALIAIQAIGRLAVARGLGLLLRRRQVGKALVVVALTRRLEALARIARNHRQLAMGLALGGLPLGRLALRLRLPDRVVRLPDRVEGIALQAGLPVALPRLLERRQEGPALAGVLIVARIAQGGE